MRVFWIGTTENINAPDGKRNEDLIFLVRDVDESIAKQRVLYHFPEGTKVGDLEAWDVSDDEED